MALLISQNRDAQERIVAGIIQALTEFSPNACRCLRAKLEHLASYERSDVLICGYNDAPHQPEFSLAWYERPEGFSKYRHPHENGLTPYMIGGLVFHSFNDTWGIHT